MSTILRARSYTDEDSTMPILLLRLVGTNGAATTSDASLLHYRFYAVINASEEHPRSVSIDMTPGGDGRTGVLYIKGIDGATTDTESSLVLEFDVTLAKPMTVGEFIEWYQAKGFDRFRFNERGAGCRASARRVLKELGADGLVAVETEEQFVSWSDDKRKEYPGNIPDVWEEGEYY